MKENKNPWLQLKNILKESTIEVVNGFSDISKMLFAKESKNSKKK